jgi:hypothetical protein
LKYSNPLPQSASFFFYYLGNSQKQDESAFGTSQSRELMNSHFFHQIPRVHSREAKPPRNHRQQLSAWVLPHFREQSEGRRSTCLSTQIGCELNCER